ncbi:hypothetical protein IEO21_08907 [Rhodonia placenta]|uniref:Uncharacterized protein n=1 Tax=Rhodonia placenta TaxID=104341 RepID=A0A8H7TY97_9APHY|nr:hypothetical protein IEO21_08907 [Postia placenta]
MFSESEFWSVLLITTDPDSDKPTPLSVVSRYLELSKDRPLDINICTHDKMEWHSGLPTEHSTLQATKLSMLHVHKKVQVAAAMALLTPHQRRWQRLHVDVMCSLAEAVTPTTGTLEAPVLESMNIHGMSLRQMFDCGTPMLPKVKEIRIDGYDYHEFPPFPVADFVRLLYKLPSLRTLRCIDLELDPSSDELNPPDLGNPPKIKVVEFTDMVDNDIEAISSCSGRPTVTLAHYKCCVFKQRVELFHTSGSCILTGIYSDTEVLNVLKDWNGPQCSTLHLNNDTSFSEDIIEALAGPLPDGSWICPNLTELILPGYCHEFSDDWSAQGALVNMIETRYAFNSNTQLPPQGHPAHVVSSLTRLTVNAVECVKETIEADLEWLDANLVSVRWGDWSGGSGEYFKSKSSVEGPDGETYA